MSWAVEPLDMNGAARALGISRRTLSDWLPRAPFFEWRGRKRVFYPEHIEALRRGINKCGYESYGKMDGRTLTGQAMRVDNTSREINRIAREAEITNFTTHDLRHTFASWYAQKGGDMYRLQLILGHKGPAMTQRYAHLRVDDLRDAAQKPAQQPRDFLH